MTEYYFDKFDRLARKWKRETGILSSITKMIEHPSYKEIVAMGTIVVPLILEDLRGDGGFWFEALSELTGADPILDEHHGNYMMMRQVWLEWGVENGYIDDTIV